MKNNKWAHIHTVCQLISLDNTQPPPSVEVKLYDDVDAAKTAAKADFAVTVAECGNDLDVVRYDSGEDDVWYVERERSLIVIAVRVVEIPDKEVA